MIADCTTQGKQGRDIRQQIPHSHQLICYETTWNTLSHRRMTTVQVNSHSSELSMGTVTRTLITRRRSQITGLNIRKSWSISESPRKIGRREAISAKMQPIDQISTGVEYLGEPSRTSGARYHSVTTWKHWHIYHTQLYHQH